MTDANRRSALRQLRRGFTDGRLALFLGAGCSIGSGVPTWDRLVMRLYINGIVRRMGRYGRVPGLIASVGRWAFEREVMPMEVAARGLRKYYRDDEEFVFMMQTMIYGLTGLEFGSLSRPEDTRKNLARHKTLARNKTLRAIGKLCRNSLPGKRGVSSVITYNYDNLLELILGRFPHQSVYRSTRLQPRRLPIYHVHGLVPLRGTGSSLDEIVLSEDQYHRVAQDPYSWSNLVQMQTLSENIGLMIGLSLTDRNLRRILDNLRALPRRSQSFALMKRPALWKVDNADVDTILGSMKERVRTGWEGGRGKDTIAMLERPAVRKSILGMIRGLNTLDLGREEITLAELGVTVIWYDEHDEIVELIQTISNSRQ